MTDTSGAELGHAAAASPAADGFHAQRFLRPVAWSDLPGFEAADHREALAVLRAFCAATTAGTGAVRATAEPRVDLSGVCSAAFATDAGIDAADALAFFEKYFQPWRISPPSGGFLTGYYEPDVDGSFTRSETFTAPVLSRPDDLVSFPPGQYLFPSEEFGVDAPLAAARGNADGSLVAYPSRAAIEAGANAARCHPIVWLRDAVDVFFIQVQGSGRVRLPDGARIRLAYDGRNGQPYSSIGRIVVEEGHIPLAEMSLARLKGWLRANGEAAKEIMQRNRSYVFFKQSLDTAAGPIGGAGIALTPLRSIAVDRHLWSYGLPFWIDAQLPWRSAQAEPFGRLMIAEDTGSAILGAARADIFFGSGEAAGARAGDIRHKGDFYVLLPTVGAPP